ncbi:unnamed protein product [Diplocarpon coronariae]
MRSSSASHGWNLLESARSFLCISVHERKSTLGMAIPFYATSLQFSPNVNMTTTHSYPIDVKIHLQCRTIVLPISYHEFEQKYMAADYETKGQQGQRYDRGSSGSQQYLAKAHSHSRPHVPAAAPASVPTQVDGRQTNDVVPPPPEEITKLIMHQHISRYERPYETGYPLDIDTIKRMSSQHANIIKVLGFQIHPSIQNLLPPRANVAVMYMSALDCGTIDLKLIFEVYGIAGEHPNYTIDGYSGSTFQERYIGLARHTGILPRNVSLQSHNFLNRNLDPQLHDAVFVEFMALALAESQWRDAFENVMDFVKPDGWLQWIDVDMSWETNKSRVFVSQPNASKEHHLEMLKGIELLESCNVLGQLLGGKRLKRLAESSQKVGTVREEIYNITQHVNESDGANGLRLSRVRSNIDSLTILAWHRLLLFLIESPESACRDWDRAKIDLVINGMVQEQKEGTYIALDIYVCLAQRSLISS